MPRLSCWFIRAALLYFAAGVMIGSLILWQKAFPLTPRFWSLLPLHIELLMIGWTLQLVMGVGFWIFPRFFRSRGDERPAWLAFWLINGGVWLAIIDWLAPGLTGVLILSRLAEAGAVAAFAWHSWPRIKPPGQR